jgi:cytochrome c-type biogenesis protein
MKLDSGSLLGAFATGGLLGMVWSPCSGPMLASALTMVATQGGAMRGTLILGVFGLGAAAVLVAVAYASRAGFGKVRGWVLTHMDRVKKIFGVFVLLVGIAILSGGDKWLEAQFVRILPDSWISLTTRF